MDRSDQRRIEQAVGYLDLELPALALQSLNECGPKAKKNFEWCEMMGETHKHLNQYEKALRHYATALELKPKSTTILLSQAWCYKRSDQLDKAIEAMIAAEHFCQLTNDPCHALVMYNLSCYLSLAGRKEEMLHWFFQAIQKDPNYLKSVAKESDFDPFRDDPDFQKLMEMLSP